MAAVDAALPNDLAERHADDARGARPEGRIMAAVPADPVAAFRAAMRAVGLVTADPIRADGKLRRVHFEGDRKGSRNGWCVLHPVEPPAGAFGSWRTGASGTWCGGAGTTDPADRAAWQSRAEAAERVRREEERRRHARAAEKARRLWNEAKPADPAHPYLRRKKVKAHGIRQRGRRLLLRLVDAGRAVHGLQYIAEDGGKRFLPGTAKRGHYFPIGNPGKTLVIAEGYATAATIHEATGHAVAVAFDAGNLRPVAEALRAKLPPEVRIIIAADNDRSTEGNPGIRAATEAARAVRGALAVPEFGDGEAGSDFNDLAAHRGAAAVRAAIEAAAAPDAVDVPAVGEADGPAVLPVPTPLFRELPQAERYPIKALGALLRGAAEAIEEHAQAPMAVCAQAVLASACLAVQAHADVVLPTEQQRPISLFLASVLPSGERKTATDDHAGRARREWEKAKWEEHGPAVEAARNALAVWERERAKILKGKSDATTKQHQLSALGEAPPPPLTPLLACPEPTFEGLCLLLAGGYPSLGIFSDEGGQFVGGHGMNEDNRLRTAAGLSALWDGAPVRRVRAGDGTTVLPGRRVAMHLMMQPGVAARLFSDRLLLDQGLLSRMLVCAPESRAGTRLWREPSRKAEAALEAFHARLRTLHEAEQPIAEGKRNELAPRLLPLSDSARAVWIQYADRNEVQLGEGGALHPVAGLANKLPEHAARIAAVLTLTDDLNAPEVDGDRMADAIDIVQHYAGEALRLFEAGRISADLEQAERLRTWLLSEWKEPAIGLPEIYQQGPNAIRNASRARQMAKLLEAHGWLLPLDGGAVIQGAPRREAWTVRRPD